MTLREWTHAALAVLSMLIGLGFLLANLKSGSRPARLATYGAMWVCFALALLELGAFAVEVLT